MDAVAFGAVLLVAVYLNWRYIERLTASTFGDRRARRLATSPIGNRIGGTIFLAVVGALLIVSGIVSTL